MQTRSDAGGVERGVRVGPREQVRHVRDAFDPGLVERGRPGHVAAGERPRVGEGRRLGELGSPDLHDEDGRPRARRLVRDAHEPARLLDPLYVRADDVDLRPVGHPVHVVREREVDLVARRDDVREVDVLVGRAFEEGGERHRPRLAHQPDRPGFGGTRTGAREDGALAAVGQADAVRPADVDAVLGGDRAEFGLQSLALGVRLGEPRRDDEGGRDVQFPGLAHGVDDVLAGDTHHREVDRLRQVREGVVTVASPGGVPARVDWIDVALVAEAEEGVHQPRGVPRVRTRPDDGDRIRRE
jgi:hypothetical protein